ncbi:MAG: VCBS repeat-containing protein [Pseudomonadota bacterium]
MLRALAVAFALIASESIAEVDPFDAAEFPGSVTRSSNAIAAYDKGSNRYPHGVLGDDVEPTVLLFRDNRVLRDIVSLDGGVRLELTDELVFEDLSPQLFDVTGDGYAEIITTRSHQDFGAQIAIYAYRDGALRVIAETPYIGTRFRWLARIATADLNNDGYIEIAYIDRPHLAKTLRIWRFKDGSFTQVASMPGLSNHKIGENFITSALRDCGKDDQALLVPNANRTELMEIRLAKDALTAQTLGPFNQHLLQIAATC